MTHRKALAVREACDAAEVVGLVCHTEQWATDSHYVELPVVHPATVAAWEAEWELRRRWAEADAAMLRADLAA